MTDSGKWSDLGVRTISAAVLIPAVLLEIWLGGVWFYLLAAFIGVMIAYEWSDIAFRRSALQFAMIAVTAISAAFLPGAIGIGNALIALMILVAATMLVSALTGATGFWQYVGAAYAGFPVLALVTLRGTDSWGALAILWLMLTVWAIDICAYFAGRIFGGPKLAPSISPKKTWSGMGGGIAGALIVAACIGWFAAPGATLPLLILAPICAVIEQGGDIFESAFKRAHDVKDSGSLIPGHGGIMDRVDGLLAVAVAAFLVGYARNSQSIGEGLLSW